MYPLISPRLWPLFLWVLLMGVTLLTRPLLPVDETRYIAVAWEMWDRHDFRVPYLNGSPYSHKPPLLFWLMHLGWRLFGVNEWSARLIAPAFSLATVYLIAEVAKLLWPTRRQIGRLTAFILSGCFFWIIYSTLTMFDMLLAFFVSLGVYSILKAAYSDMSFSRWLLLGLAIGGGLLSKGPVVLLHLLPLALLAPWWRGRGFMNWSHWYGGVLAWREATPTARRFFWGRPKAAWSIRSRTACPGGGIFKACPCCYCPGCYGRRYGMAQDC